MPNTARRLKTLMEDLLQAPLPVRLRAWDGSESGPPDTPVLIIRNRRALRRRSGKPRLRFALHLVTRRQAPLPAGSQDSAIVTCWELRAPASGVINMSCSGPSTRRLQVPKRASKRSGTDPLRTAQRHSIFPQGSPP